MTIVAGDLKFFASALATDDPNGGGRMTATVVQDGVTNNVFPDVDVGARASGRVQLRKVFAAVTSATSELFGTAEVSLRSRPADVAVDVIAFVYGDYKTVRSSAIAQLQKYPYRNRPYTIYNLVPVAGQPDKALVRFNYPLGTLVGFVSREGAGTFNLLGGGAGYGNLQSTGVVSAITGPDATGYYTITLSPGGLTPLLMGGYNGSVLTLEPDPAALRCVGVALTTATSTTSAVAVDMVEVNVVPDIVPYPTAVDGIAPASFKFSVGKVPIFRVGESVILRNGGTTESAVISVVDYRGALTFTAPLANSYPSGSTVSSKATLGDMQASIGPSFSQQTWTKSFSDTLIGSGISANYNRTTGVITTTNLGAETERWAIVFTSTTAFKLIGEFVGEVATGAIGTLFEPNNPITNTPYFSIPTAGWGTGWGISNTLRFNTIGARKPFWLVRTVSPSAPGGAESFMAELCGSV